MLINGMGKRSNLYDIERLRAINDNPSFVKSEPTTSYQIIESHKESYTANSGQQKVLAMRRNSFPNDVDVSWLSAASQTYDISPNIDDYLVVDVAAVTIDIPNRNLQAFPFEEVTYFDHAYGKQIYKTFVGKPSCMDHKNEVDQNTDFAKGVIFESVMQYVPEFDVYKIRVLQGFDRTKDAKLVSDIINGRRKYYSMGALVSNFVDPISGLIQGQSGSFPRGQYSQGSLYMDNLVYSLCLGCVYIENSSVIEPADPFAEGRPF